MKKSKLLALAALASLGLNANAVNEITSGSNYYIQNVESGLFFCGANSWGTQGSVSVQGDLFTLNLSEGKYEIVDNDLSVSSNALGTNLFTDNAGHNWTIEAVNGETGVFTIKNAAGYIAQSADAGNHIGYKVAQVASVTSAAKWYILTKDEAVAKLASATAENPVDASFLIGNANFSRNHKTNFWTAEAGNKTLAGGANENMCAEHWQSAFTVSQILSDIPNGKYKLTAQAALTDYTGSYDETAYPVVYAGSESAPFNSMDDSDRGTNMRTLSNSFSAGKYVVTVEDIVVTDGKLTIGVKGTRTNTWCIYDNFQLQYLGAVTDLNSFKKALDAAVSAAEGVTGKMSTTAASALSNAISTYKGKTYTTKDDYTKATKAVNDAVSAAETSVSAYSSAKTAYDNCTSWAEGLSESDKSVYNDVEVVKNFNAAYEEGTLDNSLDYAAKFEEALMSAITSGAKDYTESITNPGFEEGLKGWTDESDPVKFSNPTNQNFAIRTGSKYIEVWHQISNMNIHQTVSDLPDGKYLLCARAHRTDSETAAYIYVGEGENEQTAEVAGDKMYYVYFDLTGGSVTFGGKCNMDAKNTWFCLDDFHLVCKEADLSSLKSALASQVTSAKELQGKKMDATVLGKLNEAITAAEAAASATTKDEINTASDNLTTAVNNANNSITLYTNAEAALNAQKDLIEGTNVYGDGFDAYKSAYETASAAWDNGTLTETVVNPNSQTGWHASTDYNFLLTPWKLGDNDCDKWTTSLYINTWSEEGNTDGSGFKVPFFEYWTGDANSLGANTLSATISGLAKGKYSTTAWVRVRIKNGVEGDATGITFSANGNSVDACDGTQVGESQFRLMRVTATGEVTDENPNLVIKFDVVDGNNISWLSFKNVKYTRTGDLDPVAPVTPELAITDGVAIAVPEDATYNVTYSRTFNTANKWQSLVLPFGFVVTADMLENVVMARITTATLNGVELTINIEKLAADDKVNDACRPLFIAAKKTGTFDIPFGEVAVRSYTKHQLENSGYVYGDNYELVVFPVLTGKKSGIAGSWVMSGGKLCTVADNSNKLGINRWYMKFDDSESCAKIRIVVNGLDDLDVEATAIAEAFAEAAGIKSYTISGANAKADAKGIVIINGKKTFVK